MNCAVDGCSAVALARGWCSLHYQRWKNHGDANYRPPTRPELFWASVAISEGDACWPWTKSRLPSGYGGVRYERKDHLTHRIAWMLTHGPIPDGLHVLHSCDNPPCCNPGHLFLGTHADNMTDMKRKGRANGGGPAGERNGRARLTAADVETIRSARGHVTGKSLAKVYGVSPTTISKIQRGERWATAA